jgi:DNA-binding response OmpR family regulator
MRRAAAGLGSVLIVEDEVLQADLLATTLTQAGADEVRCCTTAAAALDELRRFSPDILVLDVHLADNHDGWLMVELAQQLYLRMPLVVFATGSPERIPPAIRDMGMLAIKPYDAVALVEAIKLRGMAHRPADWRARLRRALRR